MSCRCSPGVAGDVELVGELLAVVFCRFPVESRKEIEGAILACTIDRGDGELATSRATASSAVCQ